MDDYDAGTIEGLRTARAMIMKRTDIKWDDIHAGSELSEFRAVDGGNFQIKDVTDYVTHTSDNFKIYKKLKPGTEVKFDCLFHGKLWYFEGEISPCAEYVNIYVMMSKYSLTFRQK